MPRIYLSRHGALKRTPNINAVEYFFKTSNVYKNSDLDVVSIEDGITKENLTRRQLRDASFRLAHILAKSYGIKKNGVVVLSGLNSPYTPVIHWAVLLLGAIVSPSNIQYVPNELAHQYRMTKPALAITADFYMNVAEQAKSESNLSFDIVPFSKIVGHINAIKDDASAPSVKPAHHDGSHHAYYLLSSGTTGLPKAVITTHTNIMSNVLQQQNSGWGAYTSPDNVALALIPFSHSYGLSCLMWAFGYFGTKVITLPKFDFENMLKTIIAYRINALLLVPPMVLLLAKHPLVEKYQEELSKSISYVLCGAAPCSASTLELVQKRFPKLLLVQGFGMTECSAATHLYSASYHDVYDSQSIGWLVAGQEARIVDPETGKDSEPGQPGEMWLRGPNVMAGYLNNQKATEATFSPDGFLKTGDMATITEEGQFLIVDRIKELIKSKGHQVAPAELEAILVTHPDVIDAAVIGIPDSDGVTERPRAFLQLAPGTDVREVLRWFNQKVAIYKRLWAGAVAIDVVPKSPSGKILRKNLRIRKDDKVIGEELAKF